MPKPRFRLQGDITTCLRWLGAAKKWARQTWAAGIRLKVYRPAQDVAVTVRNLPERSHVSIQAGDAPRGFTLYPASDDARFGFVTLWGETDWQPAHPLPGGSRWARMPVVYDATWQQQQAKPLQRGLIERSGNQFAFYRGAVYSWWGSPRGDAYNTIAPRNRDSINAYGRLALRTPFLTYKASPPDYTERLYNVQYLCDTSPPFEVDDCRSIPFYKLEFFVNGSPFFDGRYPLPPPVEGMPAPRSIESDRVLGVGLLRYGWILTLQTTPLLHTETIAGETFEGMLADDGHYRVYAYVHKRGHPSLYQATLTVVGLPSGAVQVSEDGTRCAALGVNVGYLSAVFQNEWAITTTYDGARVPTVVFSDATVTPFVGVCTVSYQRQRTAHYPEPVEATLLHATAAMTEAVTTVLKDVSGQPFRFPIGLRYINNTLYRCFVHRALAASRTISSSYSGDYVLNHGDTNLNKGLVLERIRQESITIEMEDPQGPWLVEFPPQVRGSRVTTTWDATDSFDPATNTPQNPYVPDNAGTATRQALDLSNTACVPTGLLYLDMVAKIMVLRTEEANQSIHTPSIAANWHTEPYEREGVDGNGTPITVTDYRRVGTAAVDSSQTHGRQDTIVLMTPISTQPYRDLSSSVSTGGAETRPMADYDYLNETGIFTLDSPPDLFVNPLICPLTGSGVDGIEAADLTNMTGSRVIPYACLWGTPTTPPAVAISGASDVRSVGKTRSRGYPRPLATLIVGRARGYEVTVGDTLVSVPRCDFTYATPTGIAEQVATISTNHPTIYPVGLY